MRISIYMVNSILMEIQSISTPISEKSFRLSINFSILCARYCFDGTLHAS